MTGTSLDGIDTALTQIEGTGLDMRVRLVRHCADELGAIAPALRRAADGTPMTAGDLGLLAMQLGERLAETAAAIAPDLGAVDLVAVHGQTIVHRPPVSWQLVNPAPIAARLACPVVFDLRQADLAAGGQGAPITPIADWVIFRAAGVRRAIVNLGGFCNVTILPAAETPAGLDRIKGFDVCACNRVLDDAARRALGAPYDADGRAALAGTSDPGLVAALRKLLERQRAAGRSLGTGDEARVTGEGRADQDMLASAVEAVGGCIADALSEHEVDEIVLAGGGAHNRALVEAIGSATHGQRAARGTPTGVISRVPRAACPPVRLSSELGVAVAAREAMAMAVLGALCADGIPITLPQVTGCRSPAPVAGSWCLPGAVRSWPSGHSSTLPLADARPGDPTRLASSPSARRRGHGIAGR